MNSLSPLASDRGQATPKYTKKHIAKKVFFCRFESTKFWKFSNLTPFWGVLLIFFEQRGSPKKRVFTVLVIQSPPDFFLGKMINMWLRRDLLDVSIGNFRHPRINVYHTHEGWKYWARKSTFFWQVFFCWQGVFFLKKLKHDETCFS